LRFYSRPAPQNTITLLKINEVITTYVIFITKQKTDVLCLMTNQGTTPHQVIQQDYVVIIK